MKDICRIKAMELLNDLKMGEPPIDVDRVASCCGLIVEYVNKGAGFSGQLLRERRVIEIQSEMYPTRKRFTLAHEIGHFIKKLY